MPVTLHMNSLSHLAASETPVEHLASPIVVAHDNSVFPRPLLSPQHLVAEHLAYCHHSSARPTSPVVDGEMFRFPARLNTPRRAAAVATTAAVALPSIVSSRHSSVCVVVDEAVVSCLELEDSLAGLSPCTD